MEELLRHILHLGYEGHMLLFEFKLRNLITPAEIDHLIFVNLLDRVRLVSRPENLVNGLFKDLGLLRIFHIGLSGLPIHLERDANVFV